jgi:exodeoxyribonuclease V alpha subunit
MSMALINAMPRDRTRREHVAPFARVKWCDDDAPYVILELGGGTTAVGSAPSSAFASGNRYRFMGRWDESKFGPQFRFDTWCLHSAHGRAGVTKYLADTCTGIGRVTADRIFDKYGSDAVRMLRESPETVAEDGFISAESAKLAAVELARVQAVEQTRIDLFNLFAGRGFPGRLISTCITAWGVAAPELLAKNPFALLARRFPGCGFKRVDKLYLDLGLPADSFKRQALAAEWLIREDRSGSTWVDAKTICIGVVGLIPTAEPIRALTILKRAGRIRIRRDGDARYVSLRERADAEQRIADAIHRLNRHSSLWPTLASPGDESVVGTNGYPSDHQVAEITKATRGPVGLFVGGPGTGKTHSLSFLLKQIIERYGEYAVKVAAPTGKAAVRAGESLRERGLDIRATTIHQLLEIGRNGHDGGGWGFQRCRTNPLDCRFLVIDETSMVDTSLMADLLDSLADGTNVLFIGDNFQLAPVGHGAPLRDMLAAGGSLVPYGLLTEVRRNAGLIVRACADIKAGKPPKFAERVDLDAEIPANLRFLECPGADTARVVTDLLAHLPTIGFDNAWATQVLVGLNDKSDTSRTAMNDSLGRLLNQSGASARGNRFRVGDKVICLRNTRLKIVAVTGKLRTQEQYEDARWYQPWTSNDGETEWYVANGELGRVVAVGEKGSVVRFGDESLGVPLVQVPVGKKTTDSETGEETTGGGSAADVDFAWAITTHKSQGSQFPCVVIVADMAAGQIADVNWWYTAISRATKLTIVVGPKAVFDKQIQRRSIDRRRTFLSELIVAGGKTEEDEATA